MDLATLIKRVKRRTGYGLLSKTTDQQTQDILDALVDITYEAWSEYDWDFSIKEVSITLVADEADYTLEAEDGDIIVLYPKTNNGRPLRRYTFKQYIQWVRNADATTGVDSGGVFGYMNLGRDSDDNKLVRFIRTPATSGGVIQGFLKKRITVEYTTSDIDTNTRLQYFPTEAHHILVRGVQGRIYEIQKKEALAERTQFKFEKLLKKLIGQERNEPDKRLTLPLPPMIRIRRRARRRNRGRNSRGF